MANSYGRGEREGESQEKKHVRQDMEGKIKEKEGKDWKKRRRRITQTLDYH